MSAVILRRRPWHQRVRYMYTGFRALGRGRWLSLTWALKLSRIRTRRSP